MFKALKTLLNIGLVLFFFLIFSAQARAAVEAPKIIKLSAPEFLSLTGLAPAKSEVLIYLDGNFAGWAQTRSLTKAEAESFCPGPAAAECALSQHFQYQGKQKLADGVHAVAAVAQDKTSLVLSAPTSEIKFTVNALPAPTLITPNEKTATADLKPLISGLTRDKTLVKIFIDEFFDGQTDILENESGTASFSYRPTIDLARGFHKVYAMAQDGAGQVSPKSAAMNFKIELPFPAPTMFQPVVNRLTSSSRPFIVGLAKNDSKIRIYLDKKYHGELTVKNHPSGTANFAFKPTKALTRGAHTVYAVALDKRGKVSIRSNMIGFSTKSSAIAQSAREERKGAAAKITESKETSQIKAPAAVISPDTGAAVAVKLEPTLTPSPTASPSTSPVVLPAALPGPTVAAEETPAAGLAEREAAIKQKLKDKEKAALEKVKSLIGASAEETAKKSDRGMINEGQQNQGRLRLSVIIFILFLVVVVAWLLWVNRELVKERRLETKAEELSGASSVPSSLDLTDKDTLLVDRSAGEKAGENKEDQPGRGRENKLF